MFLWVLLLALTHHQWNPSKPKPLPAPQLYLTSRMISQPWSKKSNYVESLPTEKSCLPTLWRWVFLEVASSSDAWRRNTKNFICDVPMNIYPTLVWIFYTNLIFSNDIITSKVKKHSISLYLKEFIKICNLPYSGSHYQEIDQSEDFLTTTSFYFL